jgi:hypothetical protein
MPLDPRLPFIVPTPGRAAPVHDWCNWLAFVFAEHAKSGAGDAITPDNCLAMAEMFLEMGDKALRQHVALINAGIDVNAITRLGGNVTILPEVSAARSRAAAQSVISQPSTPPNGGNAA